MSMSAKVAVAIGALKGRGLDPHDYALTDLAKGGVYQCPEDRTFVLESHFWQLAEDLKYED